MLLLKRTLFLAFAVVLAAGSSACKKSPQEDLAAKKANFQRAQRQKAIEKYEELAKNYPGYKHAAEAQKRASALRAKAGPTPKKK